MQMKNTQTYLVSALIKIQYHQSASILRDNTFSYSDLNPHMRNIINSVTKEDVYACYVVLLPLYLWIIQSQICFRALLPEDTVILRVPLYSNVRQTFCV